MEQTANHIDLNMTDIIIEEEKHEEYLFRARRRKP